jgi:hypothetical protein
LAQTSPAEWNKPVDQILHCRSVCIVTHINTKHAACFLKVFKLACPRLEMVTCLPYCWKCGVKLEKKDVYCTVCGAEVAKIVTEEFSVNTADLVEKVKQLLHEGNVTRVIVKDEKGKILLEIPATVGVVGAILIPWLAALGVIAALATRCTIVVERKE